MNLNLKEVFNQYLEEHVCNLEFATRQTIELKLSRFLKPIMNKNLFLINEKDIEHIIQESKAKANQCKLNCNKDLKILSTFFNWANVIHPDFKNPIKKRHYALGVIKTRPKKDKKLSTNQVIEFFINFNDELYKDLAMFQFYTASRIGEAAGLQVESVNLDNGQCLIAHCSVWSFTTRQFVELKPYTKNGDTRACYLPSDVLERLKNRLYGRSSGFVFLCPKTSEPLTYRQITYQYNRALKLAGIKNVSGTHFLRHSAANIVRQQSLSLDLAQAMTGHKSRKLVETVYTKAPIQAQKTALESLVDAMNKVSKR